MIISNVEQGTLEWLNLKAGVPSASSFSKIVTSKGESSTSAKKYMYQLAGERITGIREDGYQSGSMARGIELEPEAVDYYELKKMVDTVKVGIVYKDEDHKVLCSPDRLVAGGNEGLLEIKCPELQTHVEYLLANKLPTKYIAQVQGQLFVTGMPYCDFMSYYPGMKPLIVRVNRDEAFISKLEFELKVFCAELEKVVEKIS